MNIRPDLIHRFGAALPEIRQWIDRLLDEYKDRGRTVGDLGFTRLAGCFSQKLLDRAKVVAVERVPFPPLDRFGLPELAGMQNAALAGITFKDTFFLLKGPPSENVCFHELVHVVQWARLGVDNFLVAYGIGLLRFGYYACPLEQIAYALERDFKHGTLPVNLERFIERRTDAVWKQVAPFVRTGQDIAKGVNAK